MVTSIKHAQNTGAATREAMRNRARIRAHKAIGRGLAHNDLTWLATAFAYGVRS